MNLPAALHLLTAGTLAVGGWALPRRVAGTPLRWSPWLLADACLPALVYGLTLSITARPLFAGIVTLALGGGFAFADRSKRKVLAEPVVFTDVFQALDIFRHPELALPFPHKGRVLLGVGAALALLAGACLGEPRVWAWSPWPLTTLLLALLTCVWLLAGPLNQRAARLFRLGGLETEPFTDGERAGPLATLVSYGIVARAERARLQTAAHPPVSVMPVRPHGEAAPVVLVQSESFFDVRRLHRGIRRDLLPMFDQLSGGSVQWGRLTVPSWGANTVRTEFSVLSGLAPERIGADRFNPYHSFADKPVASLAWRLRAEGYRTICVHPFDGRFYGRNEVMPNLGFDLFLDEAHFSGAERINGYVSDMALAKAACKLLREHGPRVFLFLVTMENHGPWTGRCEGPLEGLAPGLSLPEEERHSLQRYLLSLRNADAMLALLADAVHASNPDGVLGFYGDHLPAFASLFEQCDLHDLRTDYLLWNGRHQSGKRIDVDASELAGALLRALEYPTLDQAGAYRQTRASEPRDIQAETAS